MGGARQAQGSKDDSRKVCRRQRPVYMRVLYPASFLGFLGLMAYGVGLLQWLLVRLPRLGRVAGEF